MSYEIRTYGDPVLKTKAAPVADVDGRIARLVDDMFDTLAHSGNGLALAAPDPWRRVMAFEDRRTLNPALGGTARVVGLYGLLLGAALALG